MELRKCLNGHYYDASLYSECPTCSNTNSVSRDWDDGRTVANYDDSSRNGSAGPTVSLDENGGTTRGCHRGDTRSLDEDRVISRRDTRPLDENTGDRWMDDSVTVGIGFKKLGFDPVVGWLVSISGKEKGRDYRIHSDNNFIGRSQNMDICIRGDETVSKVRHAIISYDSRGNRFYLASGEGRSLVRVNDVPVYGMTELNAMDIIEIGMTKFVFVPLCGEQFVWENLK